MHFIGQVLSGFSFVMLVLTGVFAMLVGGYGWGMTRAGRNRRASKQAGYCAAALLIVVGAALLWVTTITIGWKEWMSYE